MKSISRKIAKASLIILLAMIISLTSFMAGQAFGPLTISLPIPNDLTITIGQSGMVYAAAPDYTVDGVNDESEFNIAIGTLPALGGIIQVLPGIYHIEDNITVVSNLTIEGSGMSTLFELDFDGNLFEIYNDITRCAIMRDFRVDGNRRDYFAFNYDQGVGPAEDPDHEFHNIYIENCNGIRHVSQLGAMLIDHVTVLGGKGKGFSLYSGDNLLSHCEVGKRAYHLDTPTYGYELYSGKCWMQECTAFKCGVGVFVRGEGNMISDCIIELNDADGMKLVDANETYVSNTHFRANSGASITSDILMIDVAAVCLRNTISFCHFGMIYTQYAIYESATSDYNIYMGNTYYVDPGNANFIANTHLHGVNDISEHNLAI